MKQSSNVYPSQLNTKSIACRIPITDYTAILNECINNNITINDWLLMKVYNKKEAINGSNIKYEDIKLTYQDILNLFGENYAKRLEDKDDLHFFGEKLKQYCSRPEKPYLTISNLLEIWLHTNINFHNCKIELKEDYIRKDEANIKDVINQIAILIANRFPNIKDRIAFRKDIMPLLRELEEDDDE